MKRAKVHDVVLKYFEEAPLAAAEVMLHLITKAVEGRQPLNQLVPGKGKKGMSVAARAKIAAAQKKRWAKAKTAEVPAASSHAAD